MAMAMARVACKGWVFLAAFSVQTGTLKNIKGTRATWTTGPSKFQPL